MKRSLAGFKNWFVHRYEKARDEEKDWMPVIDPVRLNRALLSLFVVFIALNFLDVLSTLDALKFGPAFHELNALAANLFGMRLEGFMIALGIKYGPLVPLSYLVFVRDPRSTHPATFRLMKFGTFVALVAADIFYAFVTVNNLGYLITASP